MNLSDRIIRLLEHYGPMTRTDIRLYMNHPKDVMGSTLKRLRTKLKETPQRIYIKEWIRDERNRNRYTAVFAAGSEPNAKKPKPFTGAEVVRRYRTRKKMQTLNSVFALATPVRDRLKNSKRLTGSVVVGNQP